MNTRLMKAVCLAMVAAFAPWLGAADARAQALPATLAGSWASPNCADSKQIMIINSAGILTFLQGESSTFVMFSSFTDVPEVEADGTIRATTFNPNERKRTTASFRITNGRLNGVMERCQQVPPSIRWPYGEAIAGFRAMGQAAETFRTRGSGPTIDLVFNALDVSGDRALSQGEIARLMRILGFFGGYLSQTTELVDGEDVIMPSVVTGVFGPLAASTLIGNFDYDDDGRLSMAELLQDRGDGMDLEVAAAALRPAAVQHALQSLAASVPGLLPLLGAMR